MMSVSVCEVTGWLPLGLTALVTVWTLLRLILCRSNATSASGSNATPRASQPSLQQPLLDGNGNGNGNNGNNGNNSINDKKSGNGKFASAAAAASERYLRQYPVLSTGTRIYLYIHLKYTHTVCTMRTCCMCICIVALLCRLNCVLVHRTQYLCTQHDVAAGTRLLYVYMVHRTSTIVLVPCTM